MIDTPGLFIIAEIAPMFLAAATIKNADERWKSATEKERKHAAEKARVRANQLARVERLMRYDPVQFGVGTKPAVVFGSPQVTVKRQWLKHDAYLWRFLRRLPNVRHFLVGFDCDPTTREDAFVMFSNGIAARIEMDMETESLCDVFGRFDVLATTPDPVLFLTLSRTRIGRVKARAARHPIADRLAFGVWQEMTGTQAHAWEDSHGIKTALYPTGG